MRGVLLCLCSLAACVYGAVYGAEPPTTLPAPDAAAINKLLAPEQWAVSEAFTNSIGMTLVPIPAGEFIMGRRGRESGRLVKISRPFHMGAFEVTQEQYEKVMGRNPSAFGGANNPVESLSHDDALEFCRKLSELPEEAAARRVYRLPSEAQWEYACRAGTDTAYSFGNDTSKLGEHGWHRSNSGATPHPVGQKRPNLWGLYDMHGNVWEWCLDWYADNRLTSPATDPVGPEKGMSRVFRGGSWGYAAWYCASLCRNRYYPTQSSSNLGFRVAVVPVRQKTIDPDGDR